MVFIDAPASEDALEELASTLQIHFLAISSDDFLELNDELKGVQIVVVCPRPELERRHSLRILFSSVHKARHLCGTAQLLVLLPLRDEMCSADLKKYGCRVAPWEGFTVSKITSLVKQVLVSAASNASVEFEFGRNSQLTISNLHGSCVLKLPGGRPPILLRRLLRDERAVSEVELARTVGCENPKCISMSLSRLNRVFKSIPESLCVSLEICSAGYSKGYQLVIKKKRTA